MTFVSMAIAGIEQATSQQMKKIGLSDRSGGALVKACDIAIAVPSTNTARTQECHITIGYIFCELTEAGLSGDRAAAQRA